MHRTADRRHRRNLRGTSAALTAPLLLVITLGGCTPVPPEDGTPPTVAEDSPSPADRSPLTPAAPSNDPGATDDPSAAPSPTDPPPSAADEPGADPATGWQAPQDPLAEGPTAAPALPEVRGSMDEEIALPTDVVVSLNAVTTTLTAETPGEYTGPAVVLTVHVANGSSETQGVESAVVSLVADDGEVGVPTGASPYAPLTGEVAAGQTAEGTYVFMLDPAPHRAVTVSVNCSAGEPLAVFTGQTS